jgi:hypothetical protein
VLFLNLPSHLAQMINSDVASLGLWNKEEHHTQPRASAAVKVERKSWIVLGKPPLTENKSGPRSSLLGKIGNPLWLQESNSTVLFLSHLTAMKRSHVPSPTTVLLPMSQTHWSQFWSFRSPGLSILWTFMLMFPLPGTWFPIILPPGPFSPFRTQTPVTFSDRT